MLSMAASGNSTVGVDFDEDFRASIIVLNTIGVVGTIVCFCLNAAIAEQVLSENISSKGKAKLWIRLLLFFSQLCQLLSIVKVASFVFY